MLTCLLCTSTEDEPVKYGVFLVKDGVAAHTNCLYLTSTLVQTQNEHNGLLGFQVQNIREVAKSMKKYVCCFCKKSNANIGCCQSKCHRRYHTTCGVANNVQYEFCHTFKSLCDKHARRVKYRPERYEVCCICYETLKADGERFNAMSMLRSTCCHNGWFHKYCLQKYANTSGYFFKCPLCNAFETFRRDLPYWGIFIPDRDAEWELENNAFAELTHRPQKCVADVCRNKGGREQKSEENPYVYCRTCGGVAVHDECQIDGRFTCKDCSDILKKSNLNTTSDEDTLVNIEDLSDADDNEAVNVNDGEMKSLVEGNRSSDSGNGSETLKEINANCDESEDELENTIWYWRKRRKLTSRHRLCSDDTSENAKSSEDTADTPIKIRRHNKSVPLNATSGSGSGSDSENDDFLCNDYKLKMNTPKVANTSAPRHTSSKEKMTRRTSQTTDTTATSKESSPMPRRQSKRKKAMRLPSTTEEE